MNIIRKSGSKPSNFIYYTLFSKIGVNNFDPCDRAFEPSATTRGNRPKSDLIRHSCTQVRINRRPASRRFRSSRLPTQRKCLSPPNPSHHSILGVCGTLTDGSGRQFTLDSGDLVDQTVYRYDVFQKNILAGAVDLEVIKQRSRVSFGTTTNSREAFRDSLLERDGRCVLTGRSRLWVEGAHIIPFSRGDEWLQLIIANRPPVESELDLSSLDSINDIRNGFCVRGDPHKAFDRRDVVLMNVHLFSCKRDLTSTYVLLVRRPTHSSRLQTFHLDESATKSWQTGSAIPTILGTRSTGHYRSRTPFATLPNNLDASFDRTLPKPAELLLHYNYGAAVVKQWGKNLDSFFRRPGIPRPPGPQPAESIGYDGGLPNAAGQRVDVDKSDWDEDDVMLYLWGNSPAARARHAEMERNRNEDLRRWMDGVSAC